MTTAPTASPAAAAAPTTLVEAWEAEKVRLTDEVDATKKRLEDRRKDLTAAQTRLTNAAADVADRDQRASRLQQELAAATTGPERHRIELELDATAILRLRAVRDRAAAMDAVASLQAEITRLSAAAGALGADKTTAEAALAQAAIDAKVADESRKDLEATVAAVTAGVTALEPDLKKATDRLDKLLGSSEMRTQLKEHLDAVADEDARRRTALATAEEKVRTAARHEHALAKVRDAKAAPERLAAAKAAIKAVVDLPDLHAEEQAAIDAAAAGTDDLTEIPVPDVTQLESWAIKIPAVVLDPAVALVEAQAALKGLEALNATTLLDELTKGEKDHVNALLAEREAAQDRQEAAAAVVEARDDVAVHEATAADRRALAVSGH